jgi:hypothetical protein
MDARGLCIKLDEYYNKKASKVQLETFKDLIERSGVAEKDLDRVFYSVIEAHTSSTFPAAKLLIDALRSETKLDADSEKLLVKNQETLRKWRTYSIQKIFGIKEMIEKKEEPSFSDKEFLAEFSYLFNLNSDMKSDGIEPGDRLRRLMWVKEQEEKGEKWNYEKATRTDIEWDDLERVNKYV